ncbi:hypothetical protein AVEN_222561-1 [Araneus ventricosus]|uniref:Uncharacterized protein n=1 Tax=Araneus ventricosus TaxID=182803 RepID=A0A4Y2GXU7_ARAVE|nr:hypothetical protein AVEN_222561-1 [Araneus ventricosus]
MWIQLREQEEINDDVLIDDFLSLHSEAKTSETLTESDILDSVKNKNNTAMNCDEDEDDEDGNDHDAEINKPSYDEMLKFINFNIKLFFKLKIQCIPGQCFVLFLFSLQISF